MHPLHVYFPYLSIYLSDWLKNKKSSLYRIFRFFFFSSDYLKLVLEEALTTICPISSEPVRLFINEGIFSDLIAPAVSGGIL